MFDDEITEAFESSAPITGGGRFGDRSTPSQNDLIHWKRALLRFLNELDEDATVGDLRRVLEDHDG